MEGITQYILSVICAAALCSLIQQFFLKSGYLSSLMKLITGLVLSIAILRPAVKMDLLDIDSIFDRLPGFEQSFVSDGQEQAAAAMGDIIKERTQAYILQQAERLGARITAEVTVSSGDPPVPSAVVITGDVSPYVRKQLGNILITDLDIAEENQTWI